MAWSYYHPERPMVLLQEARSPPNHGHQKPLSACRCSACCISTAVWQGGTLPAHKHRASIPRPPLPARTWGAYRKGPLAWPPAPPGDLHSHMRPIQMAKRGFLRSVLPSQPLSQHGGCSDGGGNICVSLLEKQRAVWHLFWTSLLLETFPILLFLYMVES